MIKKRFLSMLVLLAAVVTGAMAQTESLLTTITATGKEQASYSTANVAQHTSLTGDGGDTVGRQPSPLPKDIPSPNVYSMTTPIVLLPIAKPHL